jgi:anaerobic dimethyl sulfoxide reductase subunit B (iron-sulfur subunit)
MNQMGFYLELDRCIYCWSCETACKQWNQMKPGSGVRLRRVLDLQGGTYPNSTRTFLSLACMHCGDPPCEKVCPTEAISKRSEDGIVVVDQDKCIGCHFCFFACPFGVPQYGANGTMQKCDACLSAGMQESGLPACAATCPTEALHYGTLEELSKLAAQKAGRKLAGATQPSMLISK